MSVPTASLTPDLGGSMMPTRPRKVKFPISAPDANARTTERDRRTCVQCSWADRSTLIFSPVFRQFTSESGAAHVADLLLVQLPLLVVERQCASSAVVGAAESDHLLVRSLHEVNSRFVLMMWRTEQRTKWDDTNLIFKHIITSSGSEMRETKERFQRREGNNSVLNRLWFIPSLRWTLVASYSDLFLPLSLQQLFIYSVYNAVRVYMSGTDCYITEMSRFHFQPWFDLQSFSTDSSTIIRLTLKLWQLIFTSSILHLN